MRAPPPAGSRRAAEGSPPRPQEWHAFAARHGAAVERKGSKIAKVRVSHGPWTLELGRWSQGENSMTRLRTRFRTRQPMTLIVYRENPFYRAMKALGMQDITVPSPDVDREYIVRSNRPSIAQSLLIDPTITRSLLALRKGRFEIVRERRRLRLSDVSELRWVSSGTVKKGDVLDHALALVGAGIDGLYRLGAASGPMAEDD